MCEILLQTFIFVAMYNRCTNYIINKKESLYLVIYIVKNTNNPPTTQLITEFSLDDFQWLLMYDYRQIPHLMSMVLPFRK